MCCLSTTACNAKTAAPCAAKHKAWCLTLLLHVLLDCTLFDNNSVPQPPKNYTGGAVGSVSIWLINQQRTIMPRWVAQGLLFNV
jgi:hypothetical protein